MKKNILVTGGAGYIGSHVCKSLANDGYIPITLDDLSTGREDFVRWGPLIKTCISNHDAVRQTIANYRIDTVIDLAGSIEVSESISNPIKYYDNNFIRKIGFLQTLHKGGIRYYVFSSSAAVYGEPLATPIPEHHPLSPANPYGWSKLAFEQALRDYHLAGGPRWLALRYFNAAGAALDSSLGKPSSSSATHLITRACLAALGVLPQLEIYGNDYPTKDSTAIRDYVHVEDIAQAHTLAIATLHGESPSAAYNLGSGRGISVREILQCFKYMGWHVPHSYKPRRHGDSACVIANTDAAQKYLGWKPRYSDIQTIIRSAYHWHKMQQDCIELIDEGV